MKPADVRAYYKSCYGFYKGTGMSPATLGIWTKKGFIPIGSQYIVEMKSGGALKADYRHDLAVMKKGMGNEGW